VKRAKPRAADTAATGIDTNDNLGSEVLQLSVHTVETHRSNLSGKLGFKGAELVRYATLQSLQPG
jgi:FixJ family two-component response regulator